MRPLLPVDVDGVLNPFGQPQPGFRRYHCTIGPESYTVHLDGVVVIFGRKLALSMKLQVNASVGASLRSISTWAYSHVA